MTLAHHYCGIASRIACFHNNLTSATERLPSVANRTPACNKNKIRLILFFANKHVCCNCINEAATVLAYKYANCN